MLHPTQPSLPCSIIKTPSQPLAPPPLDFFQTWVSLVHWSPPYRGHILSSTEALFPSLEARGRWHPLVSLRRLKTHSGSRYRNPQPKSSSFKCNYWLLHTQRRSEFEGAMGFCPSSTVNTAYGIGMWYLSILLPSKTCILTASYMCF